MSTEDTYAGDAEPEALSESEYHRVLADERRRIAVEVIAEGDRSLTLREVATEVARREDVGEEDVANVVISLHHHHLPMLADCGVVEYYPDAHRLTRRPPLFDLAPR